MEPGDMYATPNPPDAEEAAEKNEGREPPRKTSVGKALKMSAMLTLGSLGFYHSCATEYIPPGMVGVKLTSISPFGMFGETGYHDRNFTTGRHYKHPGAEDFLRFPSDVQTLEFVGMNDAEYQAYVEQSDGEKHTDIRPAALIETSDGFRLDVEVSIMYKIVDAARMVRTFGAGNLYFTNGVLPRAEPALKATLGQLQPEEFFQLENEVRTIPVDSIDAIVDSVLVSPQSPDPVVGQQVVVDYSTVIGNQPIRRAMQAEAVADLQTRLDRENPDGDSGIQVLEVLVRKIKFDDRIQDRFEDTKVEDQMRLTEMSERAKAEAQAELSGLQEDGRQQVAVLMREAQAYVDQRDGEREAYDRRVRSQADRLLEVATADAQELINQAYQGSGSELLVAREMVKVLEGLPFLLWNPGNENNPLDINAIMRMITPGGQ